MKDDIKIITLGDIFKNLETEEKAFKFKNYITNLQEENKRLKELDENYPIEEQLEEALKYENIYKSRNEKAKSLTNRTIEIIKQQPSGNDEWILERLNGINYCLGGDEEC